MKDKVMLAMSGGVDSSVALLLLKEKYDLIGVTLKLFSDDEIDNKNEKSRTCCSLADVMDAKSVAAKCDVNHYTFNFKDKFKDEVIDRFVESYKKGQTPNPCINCNRYIKFSEMLMRAEMLECKYLATGHYARIDKDEANKRFLLKKAIDETKDQSYVLYHLTQEQLSKTLFPMGEIRKTKARLLAEKSDFINSQKPDSQDICFVPDGNYIEFIERYTGNKAKAGDFIDTKGNVIGKHNGISHYTIGQRKGLGTAFGKPMFVVDINTELNSVILGEEHELYQKSLIANDLNFISIDKLTQPLKVKGKIRYKQEEQPCTIIPNEDGTITAMFEEPQRAITPGQAVVFYDGDVVVCGGTIQ